MHPLSAFYCIESLHGRRVMTKTSKLTAEKRVSCWIYDRRLGFCDGRNRKPHFKEKKPVISQVECCISHAVRAMGRFN